MSLGQWLGLNKAWSLKMDQLFMAKNVTRVRFHSEFSAIISLGSAMYQVLCQWQAEWHMDLVFCLVSFFEIFICLFI